MLSVSVGIKQLARTLRDAIKQLDGHAALLHTEGWKIRRSACVVNLTERDFVLLRRKGFLADSAAERLVSYEQFRNWLRNETKR